MIIPIDFVFINGGGGLLLLDEKEWRMWSGAALSLITGHNWRKLMGNKVVNLFFFLRESLGPVLFIIRIMSPASNRPLRSLIFSSKVNSWEGGAHDK